MRKIRICLLLLLAMLFSHSFAGTKIEFSKYFENNTLRVDYIFSGDSKHQSIALDELCEMPGWAGRHVNLDSLPLHGMGQITMTDIKTAASSIIHRSQRSSRSGLPPMKRCAPLNPLKTSSFCRCQKIRHTSESSCSTTRMR